MRAPDLVRGRVAVSLLFLLYDTLLGAWTARIPAVKRGLGLGTGALGAGLLAFGWAPSWACSWPAGWSTGTAARG